MITTPDRLQAVIDAVEKGEPVDWNRLAFLQALDLARAGRQFAEQAARTQEAEDARIAAEWGLAAGG